MSTAQFSKRMGSASTIRHPFPDGDWIDLARVRRIIGDNWFLNRTAVNDETDRCVVNLCNELVQPRVIEAIAGEFHLQQWPIASKRCLRGHLFG